MSYAKLLLKGSTAILAMHLVGGLVAYALRLFIARNLTLEEFGALYAVLSFIGFLTLFRDLGFGPTLAKHTADFSAKKDNRAIKSSLLLVVAFEIAAGIIISILVFIFADTISTYYFKTNASLLLKIMVSSFAISGFFAIQYIFQGLGKISYYSVIEPIRNALTLIATVTLIGMGAIGVAYGYLVASIAGSIILFLMMLKVFPFFQVKSRISSGVAKNLLFFSLPIFFTSIGGTILGYTDTLLITYFLSVSDVGLYQAALPTAQILWVIAGSISVVLMPIIATLWTKNDKKMLGQIIGLLMKFSFIMIIPLVIAAVAFPDIVIRLLFGEKFLPAAAALQILALSTLFYGLFAITTAATLGIGKPRLNMKIITLVAALDAMLNAAFIPVFGIAGAAATTLASYFIGTVISIKYLRKSVNFAFYFKDMSVALIGGALTFALVWIGKSIIVTDAYMELIVLSLAGCVFYLVFLILTRTVKKEEAEMLAEAGVPIPKIVMNALK